MLVIGDLNSNNLIHDNFKILNKEFICEDSNEIVNHVEKFKLKKQNIINANNYSISYKKRGTIYTFHDASNYLILESLCKLSANTKFKTKYASKLSEWAICKSRLKFVHDKVESWANRVETYLDLNDELDKYSPDIKKKVNSMSIGLTASNIKTYGIKKSPYKFREFDTYTKNSLYELVSKNSNSMYKKIVLNPHSNKSDDYAVDNLFNKLSYDQKINAFIEKIYVQMINEYVIPELEIYKRIPTNLFEIFIITFMNIASHYSSFTFINFGIHNYYNIIGNFDERMIKIIFMSAHKNNLLQKI